MSLPTRTASAVPAAITLIGTVAVTGCILISLILNARFGLTLGATRLDSALLAAVSAALDVVKITLPLALTAALLARRWMRASLALVLWLGLSVWSLCAATGFASLSRDVATTTVASQLEDAASYRQDLARLEQQLEGIKARPAGIVRTELSITRSRRARRRLRRELVAAMVAQDLSRQIAVKRQQLRAARPARSVADPQLETVSRLIGVDSATVKAGLSAALAMMLEAVSSFGLLVLLGGGTLRQHQEQPQRPQEPRCGQPVSTKRKPRLGAMATHTASDEPQKAVVEELKRRGGSYSGSIRGLSQLLGLDRTTLSRRLRDLASSGMVALSSSPRGSTIALA